MTAVLPCHAPGAIVSQFPTTSWVITRGGGPGGNSPSSARTYRYGQPPVEVVLGAGAAGMLTGHLVFRSLLASVGLGLGAMGLAASADDRAGEVARSSGRFMLATFDQAAELNDRYQLTTKLADVTRKAAHRIREFDEKNSVMRRATEGAKQAWRNVKQYDDTHGLTAKAGNALSLCLDRLSMALSPRVDETWTNPVYDHRTGGKTHNDFWRGGNRYRDGQSGDRRYGSMKAYGSSYRRKGVLGGYGKDRLYDGRDRVDEDWWGVDDDSDSFWRR